MGQAWSKRDATPPTDGSGVPRKRKSVLEKVAGKVKKLTTKKKKDEPRRHLEDAGKYTLKPGGQFGELETDSKGEYIVKKRIRSDDDEEDD